MTQSARVLAALRRGPVNTTDFAQLPVIDGWKPVLRIAARIFDLQQQGHRITTSRRSNGTVDYILADDVEEDGVTTAVETPEGTDPTSAIPPCAMPTDCLMDEAESDSDPGPPAPSTGVLSDSLFPVEGFERKADFRDLAA